MGRITEELLAPEPRDIAEDTGKCHWWAKQRHCWHSGEVLDTVKKQRRICCHCNRRERSDLMPAGHGLHAPHTPDLVLIWTPWRLEIYGHSY